LSIATPSRAKLFLEEPEAAKLHIRDWGREQEEMNEVSSSETKVTPESESKESKWFQFLFYVGALALGIYWVSIDAYWWSIACCALFGAMAVASFLRLCFDWSYEKAAAYMVLVPVAIIAGFALYWAFDSAFATIPSWAAVIIFLLIQINSKMK
jgi:hypothetical protein